LDEYPYTAKGRILALIEALQAATQQSPNQEVRGMALPVLDAVITDVKGVLADDPIVNVSSTSFLQKRFSVMNPCE
jgi:hypothetical protein